MFATMTIPVTAKLTALPRPADDLDVLAAVARADQLHAAKRKVEADLADVLAEIADARRELRESAAKATAVERAADAILAGAADTRAVRAHITGLERRRDELAAELEAHELACRKHQQQVTTPAFNAAARRFAPAVIRDTVAPATQAVEAALLELSRAFHHLDRVKDAVDAAGLEREVRVDLPYSWQDVWDAGSAHTTMGRYLAGLREDGVLPERVADRPAERKPAVGKAGK